MDAAGPLPGSDGDVEDDDGALRSHVAEATVLLLDVSASMNDRCFPRSPPEETAEGTSNTLFVGLRVAGAPTDHAQITSALAGYFMDNYFVQRAVVTPRSVRLHRHRETDAWKGTCHLSWHTPAETERALAALQSHLAPTSLWGCTPRAQRAAGDDRDLAEVRRRSQQEAESRISVCKLGLQRFTER